MLMAAVLCALVGCGVLDLVAGVHTNPDGTITTGPGIGDYAAEGVKGLFGPWGATVGVALGWGLREYRSLRLRQAGKKDENRDGIEDPPATGT